MAGVDLPRWMWELSDEYPFAAAPPGVEPNFDNPELTGFHSITIACSICIFLLLSFSSVRFYAKSRLIRRLHTDDYLFTISLVMMLTVLSLYIYLDNSAAYGYHAWDIKVKQLTKPVLAITFIHSVILPVTTCLIKATLLCLILSAFRPVTWLRRLCYFGLAIIVAYYLSNFIIVIHSCHPREGADRISFLAGMASKACAGKSEIIQSASLATGVFNVLSDFYILIIPLPAVAKLKISRRRKTGVFLIFSAGGLACIASVLSLYFRFRLYGSHDITVDDIPPMATNMAELSVGLIVTCMAPCAKTFRHFLPSSFGQSVNTTDPYEKMIQMQPKKRKHFPGGLSELDSMKTFGTLVEDEGPKDSSSTKHLTMHEQV